MPDIYKIAAQKKLRFPAKNGLLTAEQLFDLPLKSVAGFDLDTVAKNINRQLKTAGEESFVEDTSADPQKAALTVALDVVKDVIAVKQAENKAARLLADRKAERAKLLDAIAAKEDQGRAAMSLDELRKKLDALDTAGE